MAPPISQMDLMVNNLLKNGLAAEHVTSIRDRHFALYADVSDLATREWLSERSTWAIPFPKQPFPGDCPSFEDLRFAKIKIEDLENNLKARQEILDGFHVQIDPLLAEEVNPNIRATIL